MFATDVLGDGSQEAIHQGFRQHSVGILLSATIHALATLVRMP